MNKKYRKKFTIGYNGKKDFFEKVIEPFEYYISSVYTAPPTSLGISSARFTPSVKAKEFLKLRKKLEKKKIGFNLIYNFSGIASPDIAGKLISTANIFKPNMVTVPGTFVLDLFLKHTRYKINISVIHDINSINSLDQLLERDEKKQIVAYNIGRRKTYDLDFIKKVRKKYPRLRLKLMVNEGCIFECPDQNFHSCSHMLIKKDFREHKIFHCQKFMPKQYWRFLTGQYIPPKFLANYCGLVDDFKLASRGVYKKGMPTEHIVKMLNEYINEEDLTINRAIQSSYGGSLFANTTEYQEFISSQKASSPYFKPYPNDFFKMRSKCQHNCDECGYCRKILM